MTAIMETRSDREIRETVKSIFGSKNAIVKRNGEVHVRGIMPNTNIEGWYLLGYTGTQELERRLYWPDGTKRTD